jgi:hypothetical protein
VRARPVAVTTADNNPPPAPAVSAPGRGAERGRLSPSTLLGAVSLPNRSRRSPPPGYPLGVGEGRVGGISVADPAFREAAWMALSGCGGRGQP